MSSHIQQHRQRYVFRRTLRNARFPLPDRSGAARDASPARLQTGAAHRCVCETSHGGERGRWPSPWRRPFGRLISLPDGGGAQERLLLRGSRSSWRRLAGLAASGPRRRSGGCGRSSYSSTPRPTSPSPKVT